MEKVVEYLQSIDEEYLIGLTNKGIVKRAAKDLEKSAPVKKEGEGFVYQVEDAECTLQTPLGESTCTCPQRTICKHIIMCALYVKSQQAPSPEDSKQEEAAPVIPEFLELKAFPMKTIKKTLGEKRFLSAIARKNNGLFPEIEVTSIVTVSFKEEGFTVKLLEPVEHSSCTCHKKELCIHKAEALLCFQLQSGAVVSEELLTESRLGEMDFDQLNRIGKEFFSFLEEQIAVGLARSSPSVTDSFERLAIVAHNADLPDFERIFRTLSEEYRCYFKRMVTFSGEQLLWHLMKACNMSETLSVLSTLEELSVVAGEFKSSYFEVGDLELAGFGCRTFQSKSGFTGSIVYFLDIKKKEWYTFSSARPTYYDNQYRGYSGSLKEKAPWQLQYSLGELSEKEIVLHRPKVNKEHKISASEKSYAETVRPSKLENYDLSGFWYEDFCQMLEHCFANPAPKELERLVFVAATRMEEPVYDKINQCFQIPLYDKEDRRLDVIVHFSVEEKPVIKELERVEEKYRKINKVPVFVGIAGVERKMLTLYPLAFYDPV